MSVSAPKGSMDKIGPANGAPNNGGSSTMSAEIMVQYLRSLGVTAETTKAIKEEVERKRAADQEEARRAKLGGSADGASGSGSSSGGGGGGGAGAGAEHVRDFARRQGKDAHASDGESVLVWGILEGQPDKVERTYGALMEFVNSSWELYRAELEAVTFPVFVHCYILLVKFDHGDQARNLLRAWGGEHESRYKDELGLLRILTAKDQIASSEYAQLVLKHKFRVRMCLAASKLLNAFLVNMGLLVVMHILNTRVTLVLEDRSPLPTVQVVRCGPDDAFPVALRRGSGEKNASTDGGGSGGRGEGSGGGGGGGGNGGDDGEDMKWGAGPPMEVALMKQTEKDAAASGLYYPLNPKPKKPTQTVVPSSVTSVKIPAPVRPPGIGGGVTEPGAGDTAPANGSAAGEKKDGGGAAPAGEMVVVVPTGSTAAATAKARLKKLEAAAEASDEIARQFGGLRQKQINLPLKPPRLPNPTESWPYLCLALRPLDSRLLKDALATPEGGAKPFLANPLSPHVVMLTFFNAHDTLCCLKPTPDGMQVAAGFADRVVRAWRTAPNAPYPPAADEKTPADVTGKSSAEAQRLENGGEAAPASGTPTKGGSSPPKDAGLGEEPVRLVGHSRPVYGISWSPDGRFLLSAGGSGDVRLWDMSRGRSGNSAGYARYEGHCGPVWDVAFGPAGYYFATASADKTACLWSTDRPRPLRIFAGHLKGVLCVGFHPNGNYVVTGSMDKTVRVWDIQTGNCLRLLAGHAGSITCVIVSPNGRQVAAGSADNDIRVWDIATGKAMAFFKGHTDDVECLDFSAEGSALVSGGKDNHVMIWDVASACNSGSSGSSSSTANGAEGTADPSHARVPSLADEMNARGDASDARVAGAIVAAGGKRKRGGAVWTSRGDGPSHGPAHSFATRNTGVYRPQR